MRLAVTSNRNRLNEQEADQDGIKYIILLRQQGTAKLKRTPCHHRGAGDRQASSEISQARVTTAKHQLPSAYFIFLAQGHLELFHHNRQLSDVGHMPPKESDRFSFFVDDASQR